MYSLVSIGPRPQCQETRAQKAAPSGECWLLRFPKGKAPSPTEQSDPIKVLDIINSKCSELYKVRAHFASWTKDRNLSIKFTSNSTVKQTSTTAETIALAFAPVDHEGNKVTGITFKKEVPWSWVVIKCHRVQFSDFLFFTSPHLLGLFTFKTPHSFISFTLRIKTPRSHLTTWGD